MSPEIFTEPAGHALATLSSIKIFVAFSESKVPSLSKSAISKSNTTSIAISSQSNVIDSA